jgi:hypothetical protein
MVVFSIQSLKDPALPPAHKRDQAPARLSPFLFALLPADDALVDARLRAVLELGEVLVPEAQQSFARPPVGVGEEVAEEGDGVAQLGAGGASK